MRNAIESRDIATINSLLESGTDVNAQDEYGQTALIIATDNDDIEIVKILLEGTNTDVNAKDKYEQTALMIATDNGDIEIVKMLLENPNIDVNAKDENGQTALMIAAQSGNTEIFKLLHTEPNIDLGRYTKLMIAVISCDIDLVYQVMNESSTDVNAQDEYGQTALIIAAQNGYFEIAKILLKTPNIDVNAQDKNGQTALIIATENGDIEIVKVLLENQKIKVNAIESKQTSALAVAAQNGNLEITKLLLEKPDIEINAENWPSGKTALMLAAANGHIKIVKTLLEKSDIEVNTKNKYNGQTAMTLAASKGHVAIVRLLVIKSTKQEIMQNMSHITNTNVLKYLFCSNTFYSASYIAKYDINQHNSYKKMKEFMSSLKTMQSSLSELVHQDAEAKLPYKINLLKAKAFGIEFTAANTVKHTGMDIIQFTETSNLMRIAKINFLSHNYNPYRLMHSLMMENNFLSFNLRTYLLSFLVGDEFVFNKENFDYLSSEEYAESKIKQNTNNKDLKNHSGQAAEMDNNDPSNQASTP